MIARRAGQLVEINGKPRVKLSEEASKTTLPCEEAWRCVCVCMCAVLTATRGPGRKQAVRLFDAQRVPVADVLMLASEDAAGACASAAVVDAEHRSVKRALTAHSVEQLHHLYWVGKNVAAVGDARAAASSFSDEAVDDERPSPIRDLPPRAAVEVGTVATKSGRGNNMPPDRSAHFL